MADPKYMRKIQSICRCQDCGRIAENADIDVELDDSIVFEWCDNDDSSGWDCSPLLWRTPVANGYDSLRPDAPAWHH